MGALVRGTVFDVSVDDPKARVQAFLDDYKDHPDDAPETFDLELMRIHLTLLNVERMPSGLPLTTFSMNVPPAFCNRTNMLHGGAAAMIVDMCTTAAQAPVARPGYWVFGGVSRTLSVTYLRPMPKGTEILIACEVMQVGKALATVQAKIYRKADMVLLCTGEHNKAAVDLEVMRRKL